MRAPGFQDTNGNHVTVGDHCNYAFGGTAEIRDVLQDGDADIVWLSGPPGVAGTHDMVKWNNLTKIIEKRTENPAGKVSGYKPQSPEAVALVNSFKADEERLLRRVEALFPDGVQFGGKAEDQNLQREQQRWRAIAKTHFQEGFMALNRAVFQPGRVKLPEDGE